MAQRSLVYAAPQLSLRRFPQTLSTKFSAFNHVSISRAALLMSAMATAKDSILAMRVDNLSIIVAAFLGLIVTYCIFKLTIQPGAKNPPAASHWFPLISHTRTFALGDITLASTFL